MARSKRKLQWLDRPVLVTGCTGLLGSHLTQLMVEEKANVVGLIRDSVPHSRLVKDGWIDQITVVHGDVTNLELIQRTLNEYEIETVFHLAAQTIVGTANRSPLSTFETNIAGTWRLLEACRLSSTVKAVIVASSDKAYGDQEVLPYNESTSLEGRHPYDVSKSCADLISLAYHKTYKLPVCITRCGNFYGPGDLNWNRIIPGTIRSLVRGNTPVIRSDGTPIRDYIYVKDGAIAYKLVAEKMLVDGIAGEAFNFSDESPSSVSDMVKRIIRLMERKDLQPKLLGNAPHEIVRQYLDSRKARRILAWKPQYDLDRGLGETISWYRKFLEGE